MKEFKEFVSVVRVLMFMFGVAGLVLANLGWVETLAGFALYVAESYLAWGLVVSAIARPSWRVVLAWGLTGFSRRVRGWCGVPE